MRLPGNGMWEELVVPSKKFVNMVKQQEIIRMCHFVIKHRNLIEVIQNPCGVGCEHSNMPRPMRFMSQGKISTNVITGQGINSHN